MDARPSGYLRITDLQDSFASEAVRDPMPLQERRCLGIVELSNANEVARTRFDSFALTSPTPSRSVSVLSGRCPMAGSFGAPELLCIVFLALIVSCPRTLPGLGKSLAGAISQFKKELHRTDRSAAEPTPVLDKLPDTGQP